LSFIEFICQSLFVDKGFSRIFLKSFSELDALCSENLEPLNILEWSLKSCEYLGRQ
jgi:hypothetical protein